MSAADWTAIAGLVVAALTVAFALASQYFLARQRKAGAEELRLVSETLLESQHRQAPVTATDWSRESSELIVRAASEFSYSTDRLSVTAQEVLRRLAEVMEDLKESRNVSIHNYGGSDIPSLGLDVDSAQVIRELAHSLGTPLAQIKAEALRLGAQGEEEKAGFDRIVASVDLCNSFVSSFREIARISGHGSILSLGSLGGALRTAADVSASGDGKPVRVEVDTPDQIVGYSNTYLLSVLAPLIENAIEASPDGELVKVSFSAQDGASIEFTVENKYQGEPPGAQSFAPGETTKDGHDGMGLATVKRLVEAQRNGNISYAASGNSVKFTISLPGRQG